MTSAPGIARAGAQRLTARAKTAATAAGRDLLGIYLNDHLAGATAGVELASRVAAAPHDPGIRDTMQRLAAEIRQDRVALLAIMAALGVPVRPYKVALGWAAEKAARLKLNGRLISRSPLSDLVELEAMLLGVDGKAAGWRTLRPLADTDARLDAAWLDELLGRAKEQRSVLEDLRMRAAARVTQQRPQSGQPA